MITENRIFRNLQETNSFHPAVFGIQMNPKIKLKFVLRRRHETRFCFFMYSLLSKILKKNLFQPKVHEMVVDDWHRSSSWAFSIGQALLQMQGPHVTKKKDRILVNDLIGRESMADQIL